MRAFLFVRKVVVLYKREHSVIAFTVEKLSFGKESEEPKMQMVVCTMCCFLQHVLQPPFCWSPRLDKGGGRREGTGGGEEEEGEKRMKRKRVSGMALIFLITYSSARLRSRKLPIHEEVQYTWLVDLLACILAKECGPWRQQQWWFQCPDCHGCWAVRDDSKEASTRTVLWHDWAFLLAISFFLVL